MEGPDLWDALRERGVDADDPDIRTAVRDCLEAVHAIRNRTGGHTARRCAEAIHAALAYELAHPDTRDMSPFEQEFENDENDG